MQRIWRSWKEIGYLGTKCRKRNAGQSNNTKLSMTDVKSKKAMNVEYTKLVKSVEYPHELKRYVN